MWLLNSLTHCFISLMPNEQMAFLLSDLMVEPDDIQRFLQALYFLTVYATFHAAYLQTLTGSPFKQFSAS